MDAGLVIAISVVIAGLAIVLTLAPLIHRDTRRRWEKGMSGIGMGIGSAMDAVWRPSAEDARAQWEAQLELPAPAPTPGDKGLDDGRIIIDLR